MHGSCAHVYKCPIHSIPSLENSFIIIHTRVQRLFERPNSLYTWLIHCITSSEKSFVIIHTRGRRPSPFIPFSLLRTHLCLFSLIQRMNGWDAHVYKCPNHSNPSSENSFIITHTPVRRLFERPHSFHSLFWELDYIHLCTCAQDPFSLLREGVLSSERSASLSENLFIFIPTHSMNERVMRTRVKMSQLAHAWKRHSAHIWMSHGAQL